MQLCCRVAARPRATLSAYTITLQAQVLLTAGDSVPNEVWDQIGFYKQ